MNEEKGIEIIQPPSEPELFPASPPEFKPYKNPVHPEKKEKAINIERG